MLGPPGAGKNEQSRRLAAHRRFVHISTGALLRAQATSQVKADMAEGELVSSESVEAVVGQALRQVAPELPILLDGFPRKQDEAKWLENEATKLERPISVVINLTVSQAESTKRLLNRGRSDDRADSIQQRWHEFEHETKAVLDYYGHRNKLIEIDGVGTPEVVAGRIEAAL